jgi:hypothetical protein
VQSAKLKKKAEEMRISSAFILYRMLFALQKATFTFANGKHFTRRSRASRAKRASLRRSRNFI